MNLTLITGGARSGKSSFAEKIAIERNKDVVYIATAIAFDDGMKDRIKKHRASRPSHWKTIERYCDFEKLKEIEAYNCADVVLLDCMTVLVSNLLLDSGLNFDVCTMEQIDDLEKDIFMQIECLFSVLDKSDKDVIIVTNELGLGIVPAYRMGRIFRDIAGRVNQYIARKADDVYMCVSGIPLKIK